MDYSFYVYLISALCEIPNLWGILILTSFNSRYLIRVAHYYQTAWAVSEVERLLLRLPVKITTSYLRGLME